MAAAASLTVRVSAQIAEFQASFKEINKTATKFADSFEGMATRAAAVGTFIGNVAADIAKSIARGLGAAISDAVRLSSEFANAFTGLSSVARAFGSNADEAKEAAQRLSSDGLLPVKDAAAGLKNLLAAGFSLPEATKMMVAFKDAAAFGRAGALSFGDAVRTATEGVKNGNSILVDNAGITKNLSQILKEAGYSAQDLSRASSDAGVRMALFNGILKEAQAFAGDAQRATQTYTGQIARLGTAYDTLLASVGNAITQNRVVAEAISAVATAFQRLTFYLADNAKGMDLVSGAVVGIVKALALGVRVVGEFGTAWNGMAVMVATATRGLINAALSVTNIFVRMVNLLAQVPGSGIAIASMITPIQELARFTMAANSAVAGLTKSIDTNTADQLAWIRGTNKAAESVEGLARQLESVRGQTIKLGEAGSAGVKKFAAGTEEAAKKATKALEAIRDAIQSVNDKLTLGLTSAPGFQHDIEALAEIKIPDLTFPVKLGVPGGVGLSVDPKTLLPNMPKIAKDTGLAFGRELSQAIISAVQGGGGIGASLGAVIGDKAGSALGSSLAKALGSKFGATLGGMLGPLGAIGGQLLGSLVDKTFGKLFGKAGRSKVEEFANTFEGGFKGLQKALEPLGEEGARLWKNLTQGVGRNNPQQAQAAIDAVTKALERQKAATEVLAPTFADVTAAAGRYGLEVTKIGDAINSLRVMEAAQQAVKDWELMARAGANMEEVAAGMADELQVLVNESIAWGHALPEAMRPILQKMIDMGLLTDDAGEKLVDLERLKFDKPLVAAIDGLIVKLDELIVKITDGVGGALRGVGDMDLGGGGVPALGRGGIVRRPTLALIGESGPEAVIPLGGGNGGGWGGGGPIIVQTYLDGYQIAEATVPHIPAVVNRRA